MNSDRKRLSVLSFFSGALGGGVVAVVSVTIIMLVGGFDSSTKTVTVVERSPAVSTDAAQKSGGLSVHQIYERDAPGVVFVNAMGVNEAQSTSELLKGEGGQQGTATGSGFEIDGSGTILTNWHVVEGASKITVGLERGKTVEASILGKDPSHDIAVLRIPTSGLTLHPLVLGNSGDVHVGDAVLAIGNPFGLERTLTTGVVSALEREIQAPTGGKIKGALQTDAPINPGNSGGPLLNEDGEVIGINSQIETGGEHSGSVGIAFAIPINATASDLAKLEKKG